MSLTGSISLYCIINKMINKTNTTRSEQFQITIEKSLKEAQWVPLTNKYMMAHFPGLVQLLQQKGSFYGLNPPLLVKCIVGNPRLIPIRSSLSITRGSNRL